MRGVVQRRQQGDGAHSSATFGERLANEGVEFAVEGLDTGFRVPTLGVPGGDDAHLASLTGGVRDDWNQPSRAAVPSLLPVLTGGAADGATGHAAEVKHGDGHVGARAGRNIQTGSGASVIDVGHAAAGKSGSARPAWSRDGASFDPVENLGQEGTARGAQEATGERSGSSVAYVTSTEAVDDTGESDSKGDVAAGSGTAAAIGGSGPTSPLSRASPELKREFRRSAVDRWITSDATPDGEGGDAQGTDSDQLGDSDDGSIPPTAPRQNPLPRYLLQRTKSVLTVTSTLPLRRRRPEQQTGWLAGRTPAPRRSWTAAHRKRHAHLMGVWRSTAWMLGLFMVLWRQLEFRQKLFGMAQLGAMTIEEARAQKEKISNERREMALLSSNKSRLWRWWTRHLLHPSSAFKRRWDIAFLLMLFWVAVRVPYTVSFESDGDVSQGLRIADAAAEYAFIVDIVLSFFSVYTSDGDTIDDPQQIVKHYVTTWFVLDCTASFPWTLIVDNSFFRGMKLLRLMRLAKVEQVEQRIVEAADLSEKRQHQLKLGKLAFYVAVTSHIIACIWYYLAVLEASEDSWTSLYLGVDEPTELDSGTAYLSSMYWAAATLTTVGYGDVSAHTDMERSFATFGIIIGAVLFATGVGKMSAMAQQLNQRENEIRAKRNRVTQFLRTRKVPSKLRTRVREFYETSFRLGLEEADSDILADLSPPLRRAITFHLHKDLFDEVPILKHSSVGLQLAIAEHLVPMFVLAREYIIIAGEAGRNLFFIKTGAVVVISSTGAVVRNLEQGSFVGEVAMLDHIPASESCRAVTNCSLMQLSRDGFLDVLVDFPYFESTLRNVARIRIAHAGGAVDKRRVNTSEAMVKLEQQAAASAKLGASAALIKGKSPPTPFSSSLQNAPAGAQTPPVDRRSWGRVHGFAGQFEKRYLTVLRRSRILQAETYQPKPKPTKDVQLSADAEALVEVLAANAHDVWAVEKLKSGWQWGPERDNRKQLHPDLVPYSELDDSSKAYDQNAARNILKMAAVEGWTVRNTRLSATPRRTLSSTSSASQFTSTGASVDSPVTSLTSALSTPYLKRSGKTGHYRPDPFPIETVTLSPEVAELVDRCAQHQHDTWAKQRLDEGWVWGHHADDSAKTHNLLLPYPFLHEEQRQTTRVSIEATLKMTVGLGYVFVRIDDQEKMAAAAGMTISKRSMEATGKDMHAKFFGASSRGTSGDSAPGSGGADGAASKLRSKIASASGKPAKSGRDLWKAAGKALKLDEAVLATSSSESLRERLGKGGVSPAEVSTKVKDMLAEAQAATNTRLSAIESQLASLASNVSLLLERKSYPRAPSPGATDLHAGSTAGGDE